VKFIKKKWLEVHNNYQTMAAAFTYANVLPLSFNQLHNHFAYPLRVAQHFRQFHGTMITFLQSQWQ